MLSKTLHLQSSHGSKAPPLCLERVSLPVLPRVTARGRRWARSLSPVTAASGLTGILHCGRNCELSRLSWRAGITWEPLLRHACDSRGAKSGGSGES